MMKKTLVLFCLMIVAFSTFLFSALPVVHAVDGALPPAITESVLIPNLDSTVTKKEDKQGGVTLENKKFPLEHYDGVSNADPTWNPVLNAIMGIGNALFWFSKFIYMGFDYGIERLSSQDILTTWIDKVQEMSSSLWGRLQDSLMYLVLGILGIFLLFQFFIQMNTLKGLNTFVMFCVVFVMGSFFMSNGAQLIKKANETSNSFQSSILSVGTTLTGDSKEIDKADTNAGVTAIMRNTYFNIAVVRPYLLMNYGTTDVESLTTEDPKRIENLLAVKRNSKSDGELKAVVKKEVDTYENDYMDKTGMGVYAKLGMGLGSIFMVIGLGVPLLILSFANALIQILILGIVLVLAFSFFISLIPTMRNSWIKPLTTILGLILSKSFIVIFLFFVFLLISIVDTIVPPTAAGGAGYLVNSAILIAITWLLLMKHGVIVSMMTGGRVQMNTTEGVQRFARNRVNSARHRSLKKAFNNENGKDDNDGPDDDDDENEKEPTKNRSPKTPSTSSPKQSSSPNRTTPNPPSGATGQAPSRHRKDPTGEFEPPNSPKKSGRPPDGDGDGHSKDEPLDKPMRREGEGEVKNPISSQRERPEGQGEKEEEEQISPHRGNLPNNPTNNPEKSPSDYRDKMDESPDGKETLSKSTHRGDVRPSIPLAKEPQESEHRRPTSGSEKIVTLEEPQEPQKESKFKTSIHPRKQEKPDDERPKRPQLERPERIPGRGDTE